MKDTIAPPRGVFSTSFTLAQLFSWLFITLALLLLGAHFFRSGNIVLVSSLAVILGMHCTRTAWAAHTISFVLALGAIEWMLAAWRLATIRMHFSMPWARGTLILVAVALVTLLAAYAASKKGVERNREAKRPALLQATTFIIAFALLYALCVSRPGAFLLERFIPMSGGVQIGLLAAYAAYLCGKLLNRTMRRKTRKTAWGIFAALFFGQIAFGLTGVYGPFEPARVHIPVPGLVAYAPFFRGSVGMMPFLVLTATLLAGGAWCSMFCYFGPLDTFAGKGAIKTPSPLLRKALVHGRWLTLVSGIAAALIFRAMGVSSFTAGLAGTGFGVFGVAFMAIFSRRYHGMTHCTAYCPMGLVVTILSRVSPWRIKVDTKTCDNCGACEKVCAYRAITKESRERGSTLARCSMCRDCTAVCPHDSLYVHNPVLPRKIAERVFVVTVTVLHVLFIAAAKPY